MYLPIELIRIIIEYNKEYWISVTNSTTVSFIPLKKITAIRKPFVSTTPIQQHLSQILELEIPSPTQKYYVMFYHRWYFYNEYHESKVILKKQYRDKEMFNRIANEIFNYF